MTTIELEKPQRADAIASLKRYFEENFDPIGEMPASQLLNFILEEIGPAIYNQAVKDAQARIQLQLSDLPGDLYADEFQYWSRLEAKRRQRR
ncbi:MAG TPA: DUF2164 domain-containing protein [Acidobacteriaceae bacterium]|nr:DUF2164 domain-containing protein [Acidobacteriaceae bacterium]